MVTASSPPSASPNGSPADSAHAHWRRSLGWRASEAFVTLSAAFAIFTDTIAYDVVIPFLPQLFTKRLKTPPDQVERWTALTLQSFGLTQLLFAWVSGYLVDRSVSKSAPMMAGLVILLFSTLLFFLGSSEAMIMLARGLQGASSGLVWVSAIAFLVSQVDADHIGEYMGYTTLGLTVGELAGPLLGGSLYQSLGHWVVFAVISFIVLVNLAIRLLVREIPKTPSVYPETVNRSALETDPLLPDAPQATRRSVTGPDPSSCSSSTHTAVDGLKTLGLDCISSVVSLIVVSIVRFGFEAVIPLFVYRHFSWSSGASGAVMFCLLLPNILGPVLGRYASVHGPRWYGSVALFVCGLFLLTLCFSTSGGDDSTTTRVLFVLNITTIGLGIATVTIVHGTALSVSSSKAEHLAARARAAGHRLSWALRLVTPGVMMSGLSSSWAVAIFLGPSSANLFHFGTDDGFTRLCLFWSALCMVTSIFAIFSWRKW